MANFASAAFQFASGIVHFSEIFLSASLDYP
ncbi:hypothetical protein KR51_00023540 [Rubidibacter lacunae KORDI 51-2]|uniref:Uncharacterized protein n=1 Tax=Rubidibacter lacunae KORDI 51-2 TaxID=582515 RepID=U5D946_9CHRO|nr:hypothetical protein KR51_00023540 [Rubidibacter lacunae KORDI 51-2]